MIIYVDESYYTGTYLQGKTAIVSVAFPYYARTATQQIKQYTGTNIDESNIPESVKMCACELAEKAYTYETTDTSNKTSERVGDYSVSYANAEQNSASYNSLVTDIIYKWLTGTGLLYRGL